MNQQDQHIRQLAYDIWQSEGCPEGQDARHWEMACKLVEAQGTTATAKPAGKGRKTATKPTEAPPAQKKPAKGAASAQVPKPGKAATPSKGGAQPGPMAATDAQAGTPESIKKTRTPKPPKNS